MIESGSHEPVDVAAWRLPVGTALRIEVPAAPLQPFFDRYSVLDSDATVFREQGSWMLPEPPMIWIALTTPELSMRPRRRSATALHAAMLIGPTSTTVPVQARGGVSVVATLTPLGWARLIAGSAADLRDRIVPLQHHRPEGWTAGLVENLGRQSDGTEVKAILDGFLLDTLPGPVKNEDGIARLQHLLDAPGASDDIAGWHGEAGFGSARTFARTCERCTGFGPKLVQRRRRFLHSFAAMLTADGAVDFGVVPAGYHDVPHFLRDAREFLGMTAKQFLAMPMSYLRSVMRARASVASAIGSRVTQPHGAGALEE